MIMNEREIVLVILTEISQNAAYSNIALRKALLFNNSLEQHKKAFITEVVNGTIRNLILIDYIINQFSKVKTNKLKPVILEILRMSVYQIFFMDVPVSAVCNEAVGLVKKKNINGLSGYVNAVLRNIVRGKDSILYPSKEKKAEYLSTLYSYPMWLTEKLLTQYDFDTLENVFKLNNTQPDITFCTNTLKISSAKLVQALQNEGMVIKSFSENFVHVTKSSNISESDAFKKGFFHIMDESSMLAVKALDPKPGDIVIDMCAAPGGKSFYAAYLMENEGKIYSFDIHEHKIKLMRESASRLGISIIESKIKDASNYNPDDSLTADKVLLDVPCSGLGIVRKKPDIKYIKSNEDIKSLAALQKTILTAASNYVKQHGSMVYSTCTLLQEENIQNVNWFTENFPFKLETCTQILPSANQDGFFIAKLYRR